MFMNSLTLEFLGFSSMEKRNSILIIKMPKSDRSGQAAILSTEELDALMLLLPPFYRAIFQTARFSAGRINEVLHLKWSNIYADCIVIPKAITKKKVRTREIPLHPALKEKLGLWRTKWPELFVALKRSKRFRFRFHTNRFYPSIRQH